MKVELVPFSPVVKTEGLTKNESCIELCKERSTNSRAVLKIYGEEIKYKIAMAIKRPFLWFLYFKQEVKFGDDKKIIWLNKNSFKKGTGYFNFRQLDKLVIKWRHCILQHNVKGDLSLSAIGGLWIKAYQSPAPERKEDLGIFEETGRYFVLRTKDAKGEPQVGVYANGSTNILNSSLLQRTGLYFDPYTNTTKTAVIFRPGPFCYESDKKRLQEEGKLMETSKGIEHVVQLDSINHNENMSEFYFLMEYCDGGDLFDRLYSKEEKPLEQTKLVWLQQIAEGLKSLHDKNIFHRNISLENIFLKGDSVKIGILGLAPERNDKHGFYSSYGESPYTAPEAWRSTTGSTLKSDAWSFGIVALELLSNNQFTEGDLHRLSYASREFLNASTSKDILQNEVYKLIDSKITDEKYRNLVKGLLTLDSNKRSTVEDFLSKQDV